jgi:hypothetical protein
VGVIIGFLTGVLLPCVLGICVFGAMWESVHVHWDLKKLEWHGVGRAHNDFSPLPGTAIHA